MDSHTAQHQRFPAVALVAVLFLLCIIFGQSWIANQFPAISGLVQIKPSLVFLDIPTPLPIYIDLILAPALFLLVYPVVLLFFPGRWAIGQRLKAAFTGLFALLVCMLAGGGIYYLVQDHLPVNIRNGIDSMGIIADIHLPYAGFEPINLRGSLILFVCFNIGTFILVRKLRKEPAPGLTREQRMTPYKRMLREKRMQKTQPIAEGRNMQSAGFNYTAQDNTNKNYRQEGLETEAVQSGYHSQSPVCWCQPVMTIKPEAVYYMPK
ncbi:hypothetical protein [Longitalea luteola]|uniref:hypothetical protein n=1 Tax=Longitalea luteola TaxID=2812563 RepID=UPI001A967718|nr:hypothetical protein [Longitalea luteola]